MRIDQNSGQHTKQDPEMDLKRTAGLGLIRRLNQHLNGYLYPLRCPICDRPAGEGRKLCMDCEAELCYASEPSCMKCGKKVWSDDKLLCADCEKRHHLFARGFQLFEYESIRDSLFRFKYEGRQEYAAFYGEQIYQKLGTTLQNLRPDAIVPVPIHDERLLKRGYNQAELLARELSKHLEVPVESNLICRQKNTKAMKELGPDERKNNLRGAFKLCQNDVSFKTIVIIDDIYTTGSTVDAVCKELFCGITGLERCYFVTLAAGTGV